MCHCIQCHCQCHYTAVLVLLLLQDTFAKQNMLKQMFCKLKQHDNNKLYTYICIYVCTYLHTYLCIYFYICILRWHLIQNRSHMKNSTIHSMDVFMIIEAYLRWQLSKLFISPQKQKKKILDFIYFIYFFFLDSNQENCVKSC